MNADRCTQRGKGSNQSTLILFIDMIQKMMASCHKFSQEMKCGSTILNLTPSGSWCNGATLHPKERRNLRMHCQQENSWLQSFEMRNVLLLWISCLGGQQWTVTAVLKHWELWRLTVIKFISQMSEVLLLNINDARPYTSMRTNEAITKFG
jgi:hypothetical protein